MLVFNYSRCNAENKRQHRPTSQEKQSLITGMVNNLKYFSVELWWSLSLTLSGPRLFRYRKDRRGGGGGFHPSFDSSENWYVEYSVCTYTTITFF